MKTKNIVFYLFLIIGTLTYAQEFKEGHIKKLETLGIEYKTEYSANGKATKDLHLVLRNDSKRRVKSTIGTVLFSVGVAGIIGGALLTKNAKYDRHGYKKIAYGSAFTVGAAGIGASIPLFLSANKNIKKRDQLKMKYLEDSVDSNSVLPTEVLQEPVQ